MTRLFFEERSVVRKKKKAIYQTSGDKISAGFFKTSFFFFSYRNFLQLLPFILWMWPVFFCGCAQITEGQACCPSWLSRREASAAVLTVSCSSNCCPRLTGLMWPCDARVRLLKRSLHAPLIPSVNLRQATKTSRPLILK